MSGGSTTKARKLAHSGGAAAAGQGITAPPSSAPQWGVNGENQTKKPPQPALDVRADATGVVVRVRAKPRASKSRVMAIVEGALEVAITAPPVDGAANDELIRTLAAHFGVPRSRVTLVAGDTSRHKRVHLAGVTVAQVLALTRR